GRPTDGRGCAARRRLRRRAIPSGSPKRADRRRTTLAESPRRADRRRATLAESRKRADRRRTTLAESPRRADRRRATLSGSPESGPARQQLFSGAARRLRSDCGDVARTARAGAAGGGMDRALAVDGSVGRARRIVTARRFLDERGVLVGLVIVALVF